MNDNVESALYLPLRAHDYPLRDDSDPDNTKDPLLPGGHFHVASSKAAVWAKWVTVAFSVLAIVSASVLYFESYKLPARRSARGLIHPNLYPGLDLAEELRQNKKSPGVYFPNAIIRANKAFPDKVYSKSSAVTLSDQDSMFYQFHLPSTPLTQCFIAAIVPPREEMEAGNKSFSALGDISAIEVWNVTHPGRLTSLSWNTRPQRLELMGTVNFTSDQRESGWQLLEPTPRFACGKGFYNIEVACSACRLEFLQIFSDPALAFDLQQLG